MEKAKKNAVGDLKNVVLPVTLYDLQQLVESAVANGIRTSQDDVLNNSDGYVDVKQAAKFLRMKLSTIYSLTHRKSIPFKKNGKKLLFKIEELDNWRLNRNYHQEEESSDAANAENAPPSHASGASCLEKGKVRVG